MLVCLKKKFAKWYFLHTWLGTEVCGRGIETKLTGWNLVTRADGVRSAMGLGFKPELHRPETESGQTPPYTKFLLFSH